jgi:CheY-like chemotaxis protein
MTHADDNVRPAEAPPESFVRQVRDVLEHLHDLGYLQKNPLTYGDVSDAGSAETGTPAPAAIQRLRGEVVAAIEALNPGRHSAFRAPHARVYNLLTLHYVDHLTIREAANEMGVSTRQADRDLRQGEQSVAALLWEWHLICAPAPQPVEIDTSSLRDEMDRLKVRLQVIDLGELVGRAREAVQPLADQRDVRFRASAPGQPLTLSTDPLLAEQTLLHLISRAVSQAQAGDLTLMLAADEDRPSLTLRFNLEPAAAHIPVADPIAAQLIERLGWMYEERDRADGVRTVILRLAAQGPTVLVIDDNQGLVSLLERYLTGEACRVVGAASGQEGLRLAQELLPAAVVLDVMMPDMHGWEVLQRIRMYQPASRLPVIICSVINNPELAQALGASAFLPKPLRQEDLLRVLGQLRVI